MIKDKKNKDKSPLQITVIYALIGGAWILFSDQFINMLGFDQRMLTQVQTEKGWAYVVVTSILLYGMINRAVRSLEESEEKLYESYSQLETVHEELQKHENYYRGVYEGVSSGIMVFNQEGHLVHANESARRFLSCESYSHFRIEEKELSWEELVQKVLQSMDSERNFLIEVILKSGHKRYLWANLDFLENSEIGEEEIVLTLVNQTEEKRMEIKTAVLNEIDQMVLSGTSLVSIAETLCQQLVEKLGFRYAWVGSKEEDGSVVFQAHAGIESLDHIAVRWDDSEYGEGAAGRAIRQGKPQTSSVAGNPAYHVWKNFEGSGIGSVAAFPLLHEETILGVFVLYSDIPDYFDTRRMTMYTHFSHQLALAFTHAIERERLERFRILTEQVNDAIFFVDSEGQIIDANETTEKMYGYTREELLCLKIRALGLKEQSKVENVLQEGRNEFQFESIHFKKNGEEFPVEISLASANLKGQHVLLGVVRDISERKHAEEEIWYKAHYDALTELPNRFHFNQLLDRAIRQAGIKQHKCAVLFLDLDQFKLINDTLGHNIGDQLLKLVAKRMVCLCMEGTLGRLGGDEFVILLPELKQAEEAGRVAQKIIQTLAAPFYMEENEIFITPSLGISIFPDNGEDRETLLRQADTAMYHAKELGRNNYQFYTCKLNARIEEKLALGNSLRKALEREELSLHYQPQVDINTGKIKGMEALLRWNSSDHGEVSPAVFIPIAEETGLIVPIGIWVLRSACVQNLKWQEMGYPPQPVSVNISARQFNEPMFTESVAGVLEETGMDPQWLEIEITESIAMDNIESSIKQLNRLKQLGLTVAIDDFGTGYSSMNYLRKLPIDTLKIDQSFVRDIGRDENGEAIVIAIIQLAQNLHLTVIAEGVETEEQLTFLRSKNCDQMQGYFYSKPRPSGEIEQYLKREKVSLA